MEKLKNLKIEDGVMKFRNFAGEEKIVNGTLMNRKGERNFCVLINPEDADGLREEGWNIKTLKPREEGDVPQPYMQVKVSFYPYPPKIVMMTSKKQTILTEDMVDRLDWAEVETCDMVIRPRVYNVNGKSGIKAYLKTLYVKIVEDEFESKYANFNEEV